MSEGERSVVHVRRDAEGRISAVSGAEAPGFSRAGSADEAEVREFLDALYPTRSQFAESDLALIRVVEDLIDVLISKEVLRLTDFPDSAQLKLFERRRLRSSLRSLNLLADDGQAPI